MRLIPTVTLFVGIAGVAAAPAKCKQPPTGTSNATAAGGSASASASAIASTAAIPSVATAAGSEVTASLDANVALANSSSNVTAQLPTTGDATAPVPVPAPEASATAGANTTANSTSEVPTSNANTGGSGSGPLFDVSQSIVDRGKVLASMSEADIFAAVGQPNLVGDSQYHPLLREALANTTRLSVMHAQQVRDVIGWKVPISTVTDASASVYSAGEVVFLHSMIETTSETVVAHELAHAVFDHQGFLTPTADAVQKAGMDEATYGDVASTINEAFATIWAERAAIFKHPDWYNSTVWNEKVQHSTASALDWILAGEDQTTQAWHSSLGLSKATTDKKAEIVSMADGIIFPKLAQLYSLDQPRGEVPAYLDEE
ncbi:hypothetical protein CC85DRAFT_288558 [Cutaneotrichosporon oleaginosum]|uniref:Peptidase M48 domain-containing protein n=1 Tax=Cutaneotrichosporon oleaginosum TaxID=879819 RepID=A0A0J0XED9_9TREE|nr:uncharacterized protein CC85DRAFT_288558 [Cutaneotrichosporon oleaginosum]KLT39435.1 hypothetical protein CC85DRAFT_288558 [Cutaneotrichosporon oleaginosum]TXT08441.1 hypothetical protein COLE_05365 [Cutaneotrichosporon oleaginosum]